MTRTPILTDEEIKKFSLEYADVSEEGPAFRDGAKWAREAILSRLSAGAEPVARVFDLATNVRERLYRDGVSIDAPLYTAAPVQSVPAGYILIHQDDYFRLSREAAGAAPAPASAQAGPTDAEMLDWLEKHGLAHALLVLPIASKPLRDALRAAMSSTSDAKKEN